MTDHLSQSGVSPGQASRFGINPGPLKVVSARSLKEDVNARRCEATTQKGWRCIRNAVESERYCRQHLRSVGVEAEHTPRGQA